MIWIFLIVAAIWDILYRRIPNWLIFPGVFLALYLSADPLQMFMWGAIAAICLLPLYSFNQIGGGDVKLALLLGICVGHIAIPLVFIGVFCGAVWANIFHKGMPVAPFVLLAFLAVRFL